MSTSTTNLNLTKPAEGEAYSVPIVNENTQKIDDFAGVVNGKINTTNAQDMTNLNNVTNTGNYSYDKLSSAMSNAPSTGTYFSGTLIVKYYNANKVMQTFVSSSGRVFTRHLWNGTWGAWVELADMSQTATSYYDMVQPNTTNKIGIVRMVGKIATISCYNREGQIPSGGFQLPYTFLDDNITAICRYYNGSSNVYGELRVMKNGKVYVY